MLPATDFLPPLSAIVSEAQTLGKLICVSLNGKLIDIDGVARGGVKRNILMYLLIELDNERSPHNLLCRL